MISRDLILQSRLFNETKSIYESYFRNVCKMNCEWFVTWLNITYYARHAFVTFHKAFFIRFLFRHTIHSFKDLSVNVGRQLNLSHNIHIDVTLNNKVNRMLGV
jgi:hypothetical protein